MANIRIFRIFCFSIQMFRVNGYSDNYSLIVRLYQRSTLKNFIRNREALSRPQIRSAPTIRSTVKRSTGGTWCWNLHQVDRISQNFAAISMFLSLNTSIHTCKGEHNFTMWNWIGYCTLQYSCFVSDTLHAYSVVVLSTIDMRKNVIKR